MNNAVHELYRRAGVAQAVESFTSSMKVSSLAVAMALAATAEPVQALGRWADVGFRPDGAECAIGLYDHDVDPTTPCQMCPVGTFSESRWAIGRSPRADDRREGDGFLTAGAGNLVLDLDIGNLAWDNLTASSEAHPSYGRDTECTWHPCVGACDCAIFCDPQCTGDEETVGSLGHSPATLPGFSGANGVRVCGVA